jgi:integrase
MARKSEGPWWRESKRCWYCYHQGKQVRLHQDKDEAQRLWHLLLAGAWSATSAESETPPSVVPAREQGSERTNYVSPSTKDSSARSTFTVGELIDTYLADASLRLKPATLSNKHKVLLRLRADKGTKPAGILKPAAVMGWLKEQTRWGRSMRWLAARTIRACCRWAAHPTQGLLPSDPTQGLKVPGPLSRGADVLVSTEDHSRLMASAPEPVRNALLALHGTGCRPSELGKVEARNFDAQAGAWLLSEHKTDGTGKVRVILLPPAVVALCKTLAAKYPDGPLFRTAKGLPVTAKRLGSSLRHLRRRLKLGQVIPYGYRHAFATDALTNGIPDAQVAALMGHSGTATLHRHYSHLTARSQALREALSKVR